VETTPIGGFFMNRTLLFSGLVALGLAGSSSEVLAHEVPYGPAGCGAGAMVIGNEAGMSQLFAGTTNGTASNQSFGIILGTLDCDIGGGAASAAVFIEANREAMAKEIARGNGETLTALSELGECADSTTVGSYLQSQYDHIFPNAMVSDHTVGTTIVELMSNSSELACNNFNTQS